MRHWLIWLFIAACTRTPPEALATRSPTEALDLARARTVLDPARVRFNIRLRSEQLDVAGNTGGALIVDRPGQGHLAVLGPLGAPIITVHTDGVGLSATVAKDKRHFVALDGDVVLRQATQGVVGVDDLLALLVGDLPFDDAKPTIRRKLDDDGGVEVRFDGPDRSTLVAILDPTNAALRRVVAYDRGGKELLSATYGPYQQVDDVGLMPGSVALRVPLLDLDIELKYKQWKQLDEAPSEAVFSLAVPPGFTDESLEAVLRRLAASQGLTPGSD